jgi:hypothetical protein
LKVLILFEIQTQNTDSINAAGQKATLPKHVSLPQV